jgi:hypothetical protein
LMKFSDLKFVRLTQPEQFSLVPRMLFEQVKGAEFKIDRLYQFGPMLLASPLTFFYVLAEKEQLEKGTAPVKGLLWAEINPLNENLVVHTFSVDKEYQGNGTLNDALDFVRTIQEKENLQKIQIITVHPKVYEKKHGWCESKKKIMEI